MEVVNASQMQEIDAATINRGVPGLLLMEQAGTLTARAIAEHFGFKCGPKSGSMSGKRVTILCGKGNNGGDGFVVARLLLGDGANVTCLLAGDVASVKGDAATNLTAYVGLGGALETAEQLSTEQLHSHLDQADLVVDALFGTGLNQPLRTPALDWVTALHQAAVPVVAIDIPSGIDANSGAVLGTAVRADLTVTFARPKLGHFITPGAELTGALVVADIGIPSQIVAEEDIRTHLITPQIAASWLPQRGHAAHKGTFGHTLIIGGSPGMTGAPTLAALGAHGVGSGLVSVAIPAGLNDILEHKLTEPMSLPMPDTVDRTFAESAVKPLLGAAEQRSVTVLGPGISTHPETQTMVRDFTAAHDGPLVIDADGLNAWAEHMDQFPNRPAPTILTPHPGEMARLAGISTTAVQHDRITAACQLAHKKNLIVVLKGANTVIANPQGQVWLNPTGGPALASGGSGDVLAGIIAGLLAQGRPAIEAATLGTFLHGLAADLWSDQHGPAGLKASTLAGWVADAMVALKNGTAAISVKTISPLA
jgi:NAD(P)H-hydrate epimerase